MFLLLQYAFAEIKEIDVSELVHPHPVYGYDRPKISPKGCYKSPNGTADRRVDPTDFDGEKHGFEMFSPEDIPDSYDIRSIDGWNYATPVYQQHMPVYCGGCWAFAATGALNDRFNILRKGQYPGVSLSTQSVLTCGKSAGTCSEGGSDHLVYWFAKELGFQDNSCSSSLGISAPCNDLTRCINCDPADAKNGFKTGKCYPQIKYLNYHISAYSALPVHRANAPSMVHQMKTEIFARGSISCQIASDPLENYTHGIIDSPDSKPEQIDHVIVVAGWDIDESTGREYWIIRNSWGVGWGELGWFRVYLGNNSIQIESGCSFGIPEWPPRPVHVDPQRLVFFNGYTADLPTFFYEMEESPSIVFDGHSDWTQSRRKSFLIKQAAEQRANMSKIPKNAHTSYKINPNSGLPFTEKFSKKDENDVSYVDSHTS